MTTKAVLWLGVKERWAAYTLLLVQLSNSVNMVSMSSLLHADIIGTSKAHVKQLSDNY